MWQFLLSDGLIDVTNIFNCLTVTDMSNVGFKNIYILLDILEKLYKQGMKKNKRKGEKSKNSNVF